jgi:quercetin dioxygenase-like cupin family protein
MSLPTLEQYAAEARSLGYDQVVVRDWAPGEEISEHVHPFDARGLVVSGEFWLTVGGETRHLRPGDLFEVPRGTPHAERYGPHGATFWAARRA